MTGMKIEELDVPTGMAVFPHGNQVTAELAPRNSGKTNLAVQLIGVDGRGNPGPWNGEYDEIHVFSPNYYYDLKWQLVQIPEEQVHTSFTMRDVLKVCQNHSRKDDDTKLLIIIDDNSSSEGFKSHGTTSALCKIAAVGRHRNISMLVSLQALTTADTLIRKNLDGFIFFCTTEYTELQTIHKRYFGLLPYNRFQAMVLEKLYGPENKHNFIVHNTQTKNTFLYRVKEGRMRWLRFSITANPNGKRPLPAPTDDESDEDEQEGDNEVPTLPIRKRSK